MCFPCQIIIVGGSAARCLLAYFVCCAKQVQQQCHLATGRFLLFAVCTVLLQALSDACTITSLGSMCFMTCLPLAASVVFYQSLQAPCWLMTYRSSLWCVYLPHLNTSQRKDRYLLLLPGGTHIHAYLLKYSCMNGCLDSSPLSVWLGWFVLLSYSNSKQSVHAMWKGLSLIQNAAGPALRTIVGICEDTMLHFISWIVT